MSLVRDIKYAWKAALKSGKLVEKRFDITKCQQGDFKAYMANDLNDDSWNSFVVKEEAYRHSIASKAVEYDRFQCKGNYKLWVKVIRLISSQFTDADGSFKSLQKPEKPWRIQFVKFCNRVVYSLPWEHNVLEKSWSKLELLERQLSYIKKTIQPYFSSKQYNTSNNNNKVTREKLVQLWFDERKKAINIINNKGVWPETVHAKIDKKKTEEYYENKYSQHRSNLKQIVDDFQGGDDNIPDFTPEETGNIIRGLPCGKKWGYDGVCFEDFKKDIYYTSVEVSDILNVIKYYKKSPRTWKGALIRRNPKKNYDPDDLTTLRDISLLPTIYKIFAKCLVNSILPKIIGAAVQFWQRAYIKNRDRQELIFLMKTAIDDFKHTSSRFYTIFVDFRDAFGSIDQEYLIRSLLDCAIEKTYCLLIADIYQDSYFEVICGKEISKEFSLTIGTKTGDPLSAILFIITLDRSLKQVHNRAIISLNIQDEQRISPLPFAGYADDIALVSSSEFPLKEMLDVLIEKTWDSGLCIRPDKCTILYERRSGNRWYKAKGDKPPDIKINGEAIKVNSRHEPFTYLGKPLTVAGEDENQVPNMLRDYSEILENITACSLPLALKIEALGTMGLSKIEHHFSNTFITEEQLQDFDKVLISCLRKIFNLNNNTTTRTMFIKKQHGGLGIRKPSTIYKATRINLLIKMLNHPDNNFKFIACHSLALDFMKRGIPRSQADNNFLGYSVKENGMLETHIKGGFGVQSDWPQLFHLVQKINANLKWEKNTEDLYSAGNAQ